MATTIDYGGIPFGGVDELGVRWRIVGEDGFEGWDGSPAPTLDVVQNPREDHGWAGESYMQPRYLAVRGLIVSPTPELLDGAIDRLTLAVAKFDRPFTVTQNGRQRWLMARRSDQVSAPKRNSVIAAYAVQVVATDGRKLHPQLVETTLLPSTSGGLKVPVVAPFKIEATQNTGQVSLHNPGGTAGPVRIRIDGPCAGPVITHVSSGRSLVFASTLVLGVGEWLDIDMDARAVYANGQANRRMYVTSAGWSTFEPGDNTWSFTAASYSPTALMTVYATPADE